MGHDGEPLVSPLAIVMLWKDEQQLDPDDSNHIKDGQYSIKGLHPGKYRLAAIDALEVADYGSAESEEALNKALKAASVEVEVKEGERVVKDLKVLGKEILHGK